MKPSSRTSQVVPILCLLLAAAASAAFGSPAGSPAAKRTHRTRSTAFNLDPAKFDATSYDDAIVRQVAIDALGHTNGSVVALDPATGRILTIVNQKMAFSAGFEPCSTIKPVSLSQVCRKARSPATRCSKWTAAATWTSPKRWRTRTTSSSKTWASSSALTPSLNTPASSASASASATTSAKNSPARCRSSRRSMAESRACRVSAEAFASRRCNLHPCCNSREWRHRILLAISAHHRRSRNFAPRVRRQLDIAPLLPDIRQGMLAAVMYGTASRSYDPYGKTPRSHARQNGHLQRRIARRPARLVRLLRRRNSSENRSRDSHSRRWTQHQRPARFPDCRPHLPRAPRAKLFRNIRFRTRFAIRRRRLRRRFSLIFSSTFAAASFQQRHGMSQISHEFAGPCPLPPARKPGDSAQSVSCPRYLLNLFTRGPTIPAIFP